MQRAERNLEGVVKLEEEEVVDPVEVVKEEGKDVEKMVEELEEQQDFEEV